MTTLCFTWRKENLVNIKKKSQNFMTTVVDFGYGTHRPWCFFL